MAEGKLQKPMTVRQGKECTIFFVEVCLREVIGMATGAVDRDYLGLLIHPQCGLVS